MDGAVTCGACGSLTRDDRAVCPKCHASMVVAPAPSSSPRLLIGAAVLGASVLIAGSVWLSRGSDSAASVQTVSEQAGLDAGRGLPPAPTAEAPAAAAVPDARPFMEPQGDAAVAYADGNYAASLEHYKAATAKNPDDAESLSNMGQVLVRSGKVEEALPYFDRAIALIPQRWAYRFNRARALGLLGRTRESVADYREAQQLFPNDYATAFNLGLALHKLGDEAGAIDAYKKAIELDPNDAAFQLALGTSLERLQRPRDAVVAYDAYLRLAPDAPDAAAVRARIAQLTQAAPAPTPSSDN